MKNEGNRGSDEPFYRFAQTSLEAILKLLGIVTQCPYHIQAETLKAKRVSPDMVAVPAEGTGEVVFLEFQGYRDHFIRHRLVSSIMTYASLKEYPGPVVPGIVYTERAYYNAALPLEHLDAAGGLNTREWVREAVLEDLTEEYLIALDPRLVVLAPFSVPKSIPIKELTDRARRWRALAGKIYPGDQLKEQVDLLALFLLNRFHKISRKEVVAMLNFDLRKTVAGQDILRMGLEKGRKEGRKEGREEGIELGIRMGEIGKAREMLTEAIAARFEVIPKEILEAIDQVKDAQVLKDILRLVIKSESEDAFRMQIQRIFNPEKE
ncbi:MAG: Rpn family recombination-promoting nuclease/putative transposase [Deltaproteobacteria bacterium]|nr:Rpn family recombination-promoting nuclease/putative transposase [Deltaproteobacteria bacterium]